VWLHARVLCGCKAGCEVLAKHSAGSGAHEDKQSRRCRTPIVRFAAAMPVVVMPVDNNRHREINCELKLGDYLHAQSRSKIGKFRRDYAAKNTVFVHTILSVANKIPPEFLCLLWEMSDMPTAKQSNLVGDEDDIRSEHFKCSRASTFRYNRKAIGLAVAYASAIRTDLSVHGNAIRTHLSVHGIS